LSAASQYYVRRCGLLLQTWSVSLSVCHSVAIVSSAKNGWTDRGAVWFVGSDGPQEPCSLGSPILKMLSSRPNLWNPGLSQYSSFTYHFCMYSMQCLLLGMRLYTHMPCFCLFISTRSSLFQYFSGQHRAIFRTFKDQNDFLGPSVALKIESEIPWLLPTFQEAQKPCILS